MTIKSPGSLPALTAIALLSGVVSAQSYTTIPGVSTAEDITPDGEVVVGRGWDPVALENQAYYWRWKVDPAPVLIGGKSAVAISDDGTVIAGVMVDPTSGLQTAGRWTQATGWIPLDGSAASCGSTSSCWDMSGDGSTIVGLGVDSGCNSIPFVWTLANGTQALQMVGNPGTRPSAISRDGTLAVGFTQGNFSRTPAWWTTGDQLGTVPDMNHDGEYYGVSNTGEYLLGGVYESGTPLFRHAFYEQYDAQLGTYVRTEIGGLNPGWEAYAIGISESGGTIVGFDTPGFATAEAWVWNATSGIVSLQSRLMSLGVPNVPFVGKPKALTPDGTTIAGGTTFGNAWIAEIPPGPVAEPYGCGPGNPSGSLTVVAGGPSVGGVIRLGVDDPTGSMVAPAFAFVSYATQPAPNFPCGIPLPGFSVSGGTADLLISLVPPNPILQQTASALWSTPMQPVTVDLPIPFDLNLFGVKLYAQGALFSPATLQIGLGGGMEMTIGLY